MPDCTLEGVVVDQAPDQPAPAPRDGLYLALDDGRVIELVTYSMPTQMALDYMWRLSRPAFEGLLGQRATMTGYLSRRTLYSARVVIPAADGELQTPRD